MNPFLRKIIFIFLPGLFACADDLPVEVKPVSVRFNYQSRAGLGRLGTNGVEKGTEVGFLIQGKGGVKIEEASTMVKLWVYKEFEAFPVLLKDSKIRRMGNFVNMRRSSCSEQNWILYYLTFDKYPSSGSEWLNLTGAIPLNLLTNEVTSEKQLLKFEKGAKTNAGDINVEISKIENEAKPIIVEKDGLKTYLYRVGFIVTSDKRYRIIDLNFFDDEGNIIGTLKDESIPSLEDDKAWHMKGYKFTELPEVVYVSVTYRAQKKENIPLDIKFSLPGQQGEES